MDVAGTNTPPPGERQRCLASKLSLARALASPTRRQFVGSKGRLGEQIEVLWSDQRIVGKCETPARV